MIYLIILLVIASILILYYIKKANHQESINEAIRADNEAAKEEQKELRKEIQELEKQKRIKELEYNSENINVNNLIQQKVGLLNDIEIYNDKFKSIRENMANAVNVELDRIEADKKAAYQKASNEYQKVIAEYSLSAEEVISATQMDIKSKEEQLKSLQQKENAIIEAQRRRDAEAAEKDFYRICIDDAAIDDVKKLKELALQLHDATILYKLIWNTYYEDAATAMKNRVLPSTVCGIYKITSLLDDSTYVGQSVDIKRRWTEHIKCGLGATATGKNKLYPAMMKQGVENFTFEVLEEIPNRDKNVMNEREKFYINFYHADESLNDTKGGS